MDANQAERRRWNDERWAAIWPKREQLTDQVTPYLLDALALQPGESVLDVGCGGGRTTLAAARLVGTGGAVVGADISAPMVALAGQRAADAGVANVSFVVADVQTDDIAGGHFDAAMSQFGVMFFDEPVAAFANMARHLRPGGRIGFACWQPVAANPWFAGPALAPFVPPPPEPAPGKSLAGPFSLGDPAHVGRILGASGFTDIARSAYNLVSDGTDDAVCDDAQLSIMGVVGEARERARQAVEAHLRRFRQPDGRYRFPIVFQIFTARLGPG